MEAYGRLKNGKEFAGVRKKDKAYGNAKATKELREILSPGTSKEKKQGMDKTINQIKVLILMQGEKPGVSSG